MADSKKQPPINILEALLYKQKADYMRQIYECLSGDSGLLYGNNDLIDVAEIEKARAKTEINQDEADLRDRNFHWEDHRDMVAHLLQKSKDQLTFHEFIKDTFKAAKQEQKPVKMTLLEFMEKEVYNEYEKAKRSILMCDDFGSYELI